MRILRASERTAVPWKNGGGTTMEVAAHPPGSSFEDFGWRISIANVSRGGPFSVFAGIDRTLAMLGGQVSLTIEGRDAIMLTPDSPPLEFSGDSRTVAELPAGAAIDLNVMTRRDLFRSRVTRRTERGALALSCEGAAAFAIALSESTLGCDVSTEILRHDAVSLESGESRHFTASPSLEFFWIELFSRGNRPKRR